MGSGTTHRWLDDLGYQCQWSEGIWPSVTWVVRFLRMYWDPSEHHHFWGISCFTFLQTSQRTWRRGGTRDTCSLFSVRPKQPQPLEFKAPKTPKPISSSFRGSSSSGAKPKNRATEAPSTQQPQAPAQSSKQQATQQSQSDYKSKS